MPTRGAVEPDPQRWGRRPVAALAVRIAAFGIPVALAWTAVRLLGDLFLRPAGWVGAGIWLLQAIVVATVVSALTDRLTRRLLPLATLLGLSLAFPDRAPSRFGVALRSGSTRRLRDRLDELAAGKVDDHGEAAARALELVTALGQHDRLTRGHTERVRAHADVIAEELGLSEGDRLHLAWGVLLHDVGKLAVPAEILNKEDDLTPAEWGTLKRHPEAGRRIVAPLQDWLGDWLRPVHEHHERWDGAGYPGGLAGTEISLAGRIVAVADAYDVITSRRSYKAAMSTEAGRREIVRCAGTQFDPEVVRAFVATSMGRRWAGGAFAWLAELPSLGQIGSSLGGAATTVVATGATAAVLAGAGPMGEPLSASASNAEVVTTTTAVEATTTTVPPTTGPVVLRPSQDPSAPPPTTAGTAPPSTTTAVTPTTVAVTTTIPAEATSTTTSAPTTTTTAPPGAPAATTTTTAAPSSPTTTPAATTTAPQVTTTTTTTPPATTTTSAPATTTTTAAPTTTTVESSFTCEVAYVNTWDDGYWASVTVKNTGTQTVDGWTVTWRFHDDEEFTSLWGMRFVDQDGDVVTLEDRGWNSKIDPGKSAVTGYTADTDDDPDTLPTELTVNGIACT
ncbi:MAG: HD domain-containing phosphohydrolase [Actinomycetota bacterium]